MNLLSTWKSTWMWLPTSRLLSILWLQIFSSCHWWVNLDCTWHHMDYKERRQVRLIPSQSLRNEALVVFWQVSVTSLHLRVSSRDRAVNGQTIPWKHSRYHSADLPVFRRCTRCGRAACWCPLWFPLSPASPGCRARRRRTAGTRAARCCGTAGIWHCRTGRRGDRCRAASASPTPPRSGWQPRPRCEELRGRLEEEDARFIKCEAMVR